MIRESFSCYRDDLTIRGVLFRKESEQPQPIVVLSHEFMANRLFVAKYARMFAELGFAAFTYDFCGGCVVGSSDGKTTDMTVFTEKEDLAAVLDYARSQPFTDADHITLLGCSQGGLVSALFAAEAGERIETLILIYPALSIPDDARSGSMISAEFDPADIPETLRCGPMKLGKEYVTSVLDLDPFAVIPAFPGNVLILHGDADDLVPISYSQKAYEAYRAHRTDLEDVHPVEMRVIKGGKHVFRSPSHIKEAMEDIRQFLSEIQ